MRVGIQREPRRVMPQHTGQCLHIHPALHRQSGEGMPQVVEPHRAVEVRHGQQLFVDTPDGIGAPVATGPGGSEHQRAVRVLLVFGDKQLHRPLGDCHLPDGVLCLGGGKHQLAVYLGKLLVDGDELVFRVQVAPL